MRNIIISKLKDIEKNEKIKILYAVESGSRGWGFESADSDYDVRFIYVRSIDWHLSIEDKKDVIEYPSNNLLDISGWDLKKALRLLKNSNPPLCEWLNSPIIYMEKHNIAEELKQLMPLYYSPKAYIYHYLHMAKGNYREYLKKSMVKSKKYFYVLRPIFACMWIESYNSTPPMEFEKLFNSLKLGEKLKVEINKLLERKKSGKEMDKEKRIDTINKFLEEKITYFEKYTKKMPNKSISEKSNLKLNILFRKILKEAWVS